MAHEITHVLQGISRHSETGLRRARWSPEDYRQLPSKPLLLTPYDVKLIRMGVFIVELKDEDERSTTEGAVFWGAR